MGSLTYGLSLFLVGCGGLDIDVDEVTIDPPAVEASDSNAKVHTLDGPVEVQLERVGNPKWKPLDFHSFSAPWRQTTSIVQSILSPPNHSWHPALGISPGAAHEGPYMDEIAEGVTARGYVDRSEFTLAEFTTGLVSMFMVVPRNAGSPKGSSPDFDDGAIIPNDIFPIHLESKYSQDDWVDPNNYPFDVSALDAITPGWNVDGHSHFPIFWSDAARWYPIPRANRTYRVNHTMTDATGEGWHIQIRFEVH